MAEYKVRPLLPEEHTWYKKNPHVGGQAHFDTNTVTVNPYSPLSDKEKQGIVINESARLTMRNRGLKPNFDLTPEQTKAFKTYGGGDPLAIRETIVGRILSGDSSALNVTDQQKKFADQLREPSKFEKYKKIKTAGPED